MELFQGNRFPMTLSRSLRMVALGCLLLPSCKDRESPSSETPAGDEPEEQSDPKAPLTPDEAAKRTWHGNYVLKGTELTRLRTDGTSELVLSHPGASYCETDNRGQALWLLGETGLSVLDLESQTLELVVAAAPKAIEAFEVRFGLDQGKVGNADGLRDDVALIVVAAKRITLRSEIICEGAREVECYVDPSSDDPDLWELKPAAAAIKKRYDAMTLAETPMLRAMAARRLARAEEPAENEEEGNVEAEGQGAQATDTKSRLPVDGQLFCGSIEERAP